MLKTSESHNSLDWITTDTVVDDIKLLLVTSNCWSLTCELILSTGVQLWVAMAKDMSVESLQVTEGS